MALLYSVTSAVYCGGRNDAIWWALVSTPQCRVCQRGCLLRMCMPAAALRQRGCLLSSRAAEEGVKNTLYSLNWCVTCRPLSVIRTTTAVAAAPAKQRVLPRYALAVRQAGAYLLGAAHSRGTHTGLLCWRCQVCCMLTVAGQVRCLERWGSNGSMTEHLILS